MSGAAALLAHLAAGDTRVCQCWAITRADGTVFGFTDHDRPLAFEGIHFAADSGMSAKALAAGTGLAVDNTEAVGLLRADVITEADILAGRYDGAGVTMWRVHWADVAARQVQFRGHLGEITRQSGQFVAELRGLTDRLNQPQGRAYLRSCAAVLGDANCGVDLGDPAFHAEVPLLAFDGPDRVIVAASPHAAGMFAQGRLIVQSGASAGLSVVIQHDEITPQGRALRLWEAPRGGMAPGDGLRLVAGCDRSAATCAATFANLLNFRGFPDIPGEDWLMSVPRSDGRNDGGSLTR